MKKEVEGHKFEFQIPQNQIPLLLKKHFIKCYLIILKVYRDTLTLLQPFILFEKIYNYRQDGDKGHI